MKSVVLRRTTSLIFAALLAGTMLSGCIAIISTAPGRFVAVAVSPTEIRLTWDWVGGAEGSGFNIYRAEEDTGEYTLINPHGILATAYTDSNLEPDTRYSYRIAALRLGREQTLSSPVYCTTSPVLADVRPVDGSRFNRVSDPITVIFGDFVEPSSVFASSFVLTDATGTEVAGSLTGDRTLVFTPDSLLWFNTLYSLSITVELINAVGNRQTIERVFTFRTEPIPIGAGWWHMLARRSDGTAWAWGANWYGMLGDQSYVDSTDPVQVVGPGGSGVLTDVVQVTGGESHSIALLADGTVWSWGENDSGQLGNPDYSASLTPVQVVGPSGGFLNDIVAVDASYYQSFALDNDGKLWAWGYNGDYSIGDGTDTDQYSPVPVVFEADTSVPLSDVIAASAAISHTLALRSDGTVWAWGWNPYGEIGDGTTDDHLAAVQVVGIGGVGFLTDVVAIDAGNYFSTALLGDGTMVAWGGNYEGQLGDGEASGFDTQVPVQVLRADGLGPLTNIVSFNAAYDHVVAMKNDRTVWSWGFNRFGQLGDGAFTTIDSNLPVQAKNADGSFLTDVAAVYAIDGYSSYALMIDGSILSWGYNDQGELGAVTTEVYGGRTSSTVPVQVGDLDLF